MCIASNIVRHRAHCRMFGRAHAVVSCTSDRLLVIYLTSIFLPICTICVGATRAVYCLLSKHFGSSHEPARAKVSNCVRVLQHQAVHTKQIFLTFRQHILQDLSYPPPVRQSCVTGSLDRSYSPSTAQAERVGARAASTLRQRMGLWIGLSLIHI